MDFLRAERERRRSLRPSAITDFQLSRLRQMLMAILPANRFYAKRLAGLDLGVKSLADLSSWPLTTKSDLMDDEGGFANNLTWPSDRYVRYHRTSGTRGRPLVVLDTLDDWRWWCEAWQYVLDVAELEPGDRALLAFSFGPFIGFWSAFDAATMRGLLVAPAGGMSTAARVQLLKSFGAKVLFCTPSYALHLADQAEADGIAVGSLDVRKIIVAGEPGGSMPEVRDLIESRWQATVFDHAGASEVGPWGFPDPQRRGLFVNEADFIAEFLSPNTLQAARPGETAELVLTSLGRYGAPVIRYRTGDLVRPVRYETGDCNFTLLQGGVLGRVDDMLIVRGVNVFPTSIEAILRSTVGANNFRMTAFRQGAMDALSIEIEDSIESANHVMKEIEHRLGLRVEVRSVAVGSLPKSDGKSARFIDQRLTKSTC